MQIYHMLTVGSAQDTEKTATTVVALLKRGCGIREESDIIYSAGALDEV